MSVSTVYIAMRENNIHRIYKKNSVIADAGDIGVSWNMNSYYKGFSKI